MLRDELLCAQRWEWAVARSEVVSGNGGVDAVVVNSRG